MGVFSDCFLRVVDQLHATHLRYTKEAYCFVYEALGVAVHALDLEPDQHLSGEELIRIGVVPLAFKRWDFLAPKVFEHWNVFCSEDVGNIVHHFVLVSVFNKDSADRWEDFSKIDMLAEFKRLMDINC